MGDESHEIKRGSGKWKQDLRIGFQTTSTINAFYSPLHTTVKTANRLENTYLI